MIKSNGNINQVKQDVQSLYGQEVDVLVNLGRNKFATFYGRVTGIYPALFTVSPLDGFTGKTTYSYSEMLCGKVNLQKKAN